MKNSPQTAVLTPFCGEFEPSRFSCRRFVGSDCYTKDCSRELSASITRWQERNKFSLDSLKSILLISQ